MGVSVRDAERLQDLVGQLLDGWYEHVEYALVIAGRTELRGAQRRHEALVWQLRDSGCQGGGIAQGGGTPYNKPGSRPPGNTAGLHWLDHITMHSNSWYRELYQEAWSRPYPLCAWVTALRELPELAHKVEDDNPQLVIRVTRDANTWVKRARIILGYDKPEITLRDTVCGECGGALVVATDASSDVRCVGTEDTAACGVKYPRYRWVEMVSDVG